MVVILRRFVELICVVAFCFALNSCNFDPYSDTRPFDYGDAKWICKNPEAWFLVDLTQEEYYYPKGEIIFNNQSIQVKFRFIHQTNQVFIDLLNCGDSSSITGYDSLLDGKCTFSPEKLVIKVDKTTDTMFNGKYDEIVFKRESAESEE